jgi:hypothetical protein
MLDIADTIEGELTHFDILVANLQPMCSEGPDG